MAIFDFLKTAGKKLFEAVTHTEAAQKEEALKAHLEKLNLGIDSPQVKVDGDQVTITGKAASQEAMEKAILAVGNVEGIAKVNAQIETPQAQQAQEPQFYKVKSGDTLSKISKEVYGNANRYNEIFEANKPLLKDVNEIYPGQNLRIPQDLKQAA